MPELAVVSAASRAVLPTNAFLRSGQALASPNGWFTATMDPDGALTIRVDAIELASYPPPTGAEPIVGDYFTLLQPDGNLCVYIGKGPDDNCGLLWSARADKGTPGSYFAIMQDDGNLCVYAGTGPADKRELIWASNTAVPEPLPPRDVVLADTMKASSGLSWHLAAGVTFVQRLRAAASGVSTQLVIRMGINQNPYGARIRLLRDAEVLLDQSYANRRQRTSDWGTVFELDDAAPVRAGEWIAIEVTPAAGIDIEPLFLESPNLQPGNLAGYGAMSMRFRLDAVASAGRARAERLAFPDGAHADTHRLQDEPYLSYPWGMRQRAEALNDPDFAVTSTAWNFGPVAPLWSAYPQAQLAGGPVPFPPGPIVVPRLFDYWPVRPGVYTFTVEISGVHRDGRPGMEFMEGIFGVQAPVVVNTSRASTAVRVITTAGGGKMLQFGTVSSSQLPQAQRVPGVRFSFRCRMPAVGGGWFGAIQFVNGWRRFTLQNDTVEELSTGGNWLLDRSADDGVITYGGPGTQRQAAANSEAVVEVNDSPAAGLRDNCKRVQVQETFRMYIAFLSDRAESRWMPLGYFEWSWSGTVSRDSMAVPWPNQPSAAANSQTFGMVFTPSNSMPAWAGVIRLLQLQAAQLVGPFPAEIDIPSWTQPVLDAREMAIRFDGADSAEMRGRVAAAIGSPVERFVSGPQAYLVWTTPDAARAATRVAGVTAIVEIPPRDRRVQPKTPRDYELIAAAKEFVVYVSPFCLYDSQRYAAVAAPAQLTEVAFALRRIAGSRGASVASVVARDESKLNLTFTAAPGFAVLDALAEHPQVQWIELLSHFRPDDPVGPVDQ